MKIFIVYQLVRKDMDVNEHEIPSKFKLRQKLIHRSSIFIVFFNIFTSQFDYFTN